MHNIDTETIRKSRNEELAECTMVEVPELAQESKVSADGLSESVSEFDSQTNRKEISEKVVDPLNVSILNLGKFCFIFALHGSEIPLLARNSILRNGKSAQCTD